MRRRQPTTRKFKLGTVETHRKCRLEFKYREHQTYNRYHDVWGISVLASNGASIEHSATLKLHFNGRKLLSGRFSSALPQELKDQIVSALKKIKPSNRSNCPSRTRLVVQAKRKEGVELLFDPPSYEENEYHYWKVKAPNGDIGEFSVTLPRDSERSPFVSGAEIHKEYRGKGIGKQVYRTLVKVYRTLESDQFRTSVHAFRVWRSLNAVRINDKNDVGSNRYRLTYEQITSRSHRKRY